MICPKCNHKFKTPPTASEMGAKKTEAKIRASRENGKKGGRPRKHLKLNNAGNSDITQNEAAGREKGSAASSPSPLLISPLE
jgi:hypothetical protein